MPLLSEILNKHIDAVNFFGNKKTPPVTAGPF